MKLFHILRQTEVEAYIMKGEDYKEGHPTYQSFRVGKESGHYLVAKYIDEWGETSEGILSEKYSQDYILKEASDEEKRVLKSLGFKMINL